MGKRKEKVQASIPKKQPRKTSTQISMVEDSEMLELHMTSSEDEAWMSEQQPMPIYENEGPTATGNHDVQVLAAPSANVCISMPVGNAAVSNNFRTSLQLRRLRASRVRTAAPKPASSTLGTRSRAPERGGPTTAVSAGASPSIEPSAAVRPRAPRRKVSAAAAQIGAPLSEELPAAARPRALRRGRPTNAVQADVPFSIDPPRAARSRAPQRHVSTAVERSRSPPVREHLHTADQFNEPPSVGPAISTCLRRPPRRVSPVAEIIEHSNDVNEEFADQLAEVETPYASENFYVDMRNDLDSRFHSTQNDSLNDNRCNEYDRLKNVLELTLAAIRESTVNVDNSRLTHRITSAKSLPSFYGDPLDWIRFKQSFDLSTELGDYSDKENIMRLYDALKGEARDTVKTLFSAGNSAKDIMKTLEMRFGNSKFILSKIVNDIKELPSIDSHRITLLEFATKLKSAVTAIKGLNHLGYLHSPDLAESMLRKLPNDMLSNYIRFATSQDKNKSDLEKIADFLYSEAEMSLEAGVISIDTKHSLKPRQIDRSKRSSRSPVKTVCTTVSNNNSYFKNNDRRRFDCAYCGRKHKTDSCNEFLKAPLAQRWRVIKANRLCYNCFETNHQRDKCKHSHCKRCGRKHHELLHFDYNSKNESVHTKINSSNNLVNNEEPTL